MQELNKYSFYDLFLRNLLKNIPDKNDCGDISIRIIDEHKPYSYP